MKSFEKGKKKGSFYIEIAFVILFFLSIITYLSIETTLEEDTQNNKQEIAIKKSLSQSLCTQMILNSGTPTSWNSSTIILLGLKNENESTLSQTKISQLSTLSNQTLLSLSLDKISVSVVDAITRNSIAQTINTPRVKSQIHQTSTCYGMSDSNQSVSIEVRVA